MWDLIEARYGGLPAVKVAERQIGGMTAGIPDDWYRWIPDQITAEEYDDLPRDFCRTSDEQPVRPVGDDLD